MNKKLLSILPVIGICSGCSTMEFVNGPKMQDTIIHEKWHHVGFEGLIEYSAPINVVAQCGDDQWDTVTIERTFFNWLAGFVSVPIADAGVPFSIYGPWTVIYECREPID